MRWLRERPESHSELAQVDWKGRWKKTSGSKNASESDQPAKSRNGRLFDDEDEDDDDESEESEEEDAAPGQLVR